MTFDIKEVPCQRKDNGKKLFLTKCTSMATEPSKHIILLHGLTLTQHVWDIEWKDYSVTRFLATEGYTVWRLDAGGFGRSERYECGWDCTTDNAVLDVITAIETIRDHLGIADLKIDIMGWSWGTMVGSRTAIRKPDMVRRLVMVAPVTGGSFKSYPEGSYKEDKAVISYDWIGRLFRYSLTGGDEIAAEANPQEGDDVDYVITERPVVGIAFQNVVHYDMTDARAQGSTIEIYYHQDEWLIDGPAILCPSEIIVGTDDVYSTPERIKELYEALPEGSESHTLWGAGHGMFFEKDYYKKFQQFVINFLNK